VNKHTFRLPHGAWFNEKELELRLPSDWHVDFADIPADTRKPLSSDDLQQRLMEPIDSPPLDQLASRGKKAVIIFDDLSRPTDVAAVAPLVVEQLTRGGGVAEDKISFVAALGTHGANTLIDFTKKLGSDLVRRYPVYNHNPYENCSYVGVTRSGLPLYINDEVLSADLKIGIGSIIPHPFNGFSGGGKIMFPGVSSMESVRGNHARIIADFQKRRVGRLGNLGDPANSSTAEDIEDAVRLTGFDFKIDILPNSRLRAVEMVAGHPLAAHSKGVEMARELYKTKYYGNADIVIANANAKSSEALIALLLGSTSLKTSGGDLVLAVDCPAGQVVHYLMGQHGDNFGGSLWPGEAIFPANIDRGILLSPSPGQRFGLFRRLHECSEWPEVLALLQDKHGHGARVVVYKDATMQYYHNSAEGGDNNA